MLEKLLGCYAVQINDTKYCYIINKLPAQNHSR